MVAFTSRETQSLQRVASRRIRFIELMYARLVSELPEGSEWLYEVKFDGYLLLAEGIQRGDALVEARKPFHKAIPADRPCVRTTPT